MNSPRNERAEALIREEAARLRDLLGTGVSTLFGVAFDIDNPDHLLVAAYSSGLDKGRKQASEALDVMAGLTIGRDEKPKQPPTRYAEFVTRHVEFITWVFCMTMVILIAWGAIPR